MSFLELDKKDSTAVAVLDDQGGSVRYGDLTAFAGEFAGWIGKRTLIFILTENNVGAVAGYVASLYGRIVPLMLNSAMDSDMLNGLISKYRPEFLWLPEKIAAEHPYPQIFKRYGFALLKTGLSTYSLNDQLALLLTTSGSTGSPKLVRHSYGNIEANARNICRFFELGVADRPFIDLPVNYTYGLSVVTSHLYAGGTLLMSSIGMMQADYWKFMKEQRATSFTGVPYSFELLKKLGFFRMNLPDLRLLTQGGGKLSEELQREFAEFAERTGRRFIITYGQTEGTARMAFLPAELASVKLGSMGRAIPGGRIVLVDENSEEIREPGVMGEMVYMGPNVTLGYAENGEDLRKGDERGGVLPTGDMARMDPEGCLYIVGRKKRFLKLFGYRISLDEAEQMVNSEFNIECACTGTDEKMFVFITREELQKKVGTFLAGKTGLFNSAFEVRVIGEIPRNPAGKILYAELLT